MSELTWNSGPPPSIGWWQASWSKNPKVLRWWDGKEWSVAVPEERTSKEAAELALVKSVFFSNIEWLPRPPSWPPQSYT